MKKVVAFLALTVGFTALQAQEKTERQADQYNKWSVELGGGFNKPERPLTEGYYTKNISPFTTDLGVRYMFNNKFGLKADFGYNSFKGNGDGSKDFDSKYYRVDLQAVANLGRIMNFETWTNTFGLLGHAGVGLGRLESDNLVGKDRVGNFIGGITGQIRLSNRVALTGDFSTILNASQDATFDGQAITNSNGFKGVLFNGTIGLNVYLGKHEKHADWTVISNNADVSDLENKVAELKAQVKTISEQKPTVIEKQISAPAAAAPDKDLIKNMINDKYFSVYFDFNKATPAETSTAALDVVLTYLKNNPSANVTLLGYADQVGKSDYNERLSLARANNVKTILEKAGIASSRISVDPKGADTTFAKDSEEARRLARRVTFILR
ncbi:OmpA family protein [Flavobacterium reichenbachii]|uniref:Flagellar motor protein MotB n=1 Tax=Flavobacterium reichenbachii TaxID=362418 RepID=A0A085ZSY2_9FLAO|nr:OmpA family protein [Flavobacterium reichenbachii]KFF07546.1 flagellar motor protein MotB [Flavobacterium reichenbachii]OXB14186.1 flagellar motor protein MotB [Flavobacterium reichenbachii]